MLSRVTSSQEKLGHWVPSGLFFTEASQAYDCTLLLGKSVLCVTSHGREQAEGSQSRRSLGSTCVFSPYHPSVSPITWLQENLLQAWQYTSPLTPSQRRRWYPTPVLLPGKSHGRRSLLGCRPWGREESDMTERLHFHFSLSCIGEGNGNPLQCSCLENPRDGGAWWAAVSGVAQSRTWLKWLSSSSSWLPPVSLPMWG